MLIHFFSNKLSLLRLQRFRSEKIICNTKLFDKTKNAINFSHPVSRVDFSKIIVFETLRFLTYPAGDFILSQLTKHVLKKRKLVDTTNHVQSILISVSLQHDSMPVSQ